MKKIASILLLCLTTLSYAQQTDYVALSTKFVQAALSNDSKFDEYKSIIAKADEGELLEQIKNDTDKKTFFINLYNGFTNNELKKHPEKYDDRGAFFKSKQFVVAGHELSLDIIEHGFLRRSSVKWSLGKLHKLFPNKLDRTYRVDDVDYRIHFALNCGAKSCPPVVAYTAKDLDQQLEKSTKDYVTKVAKYNKEEDEVTLPALMSWFRGDFGSRCGILKIIKKFEIIPEDKKPKFKYADYDWTLDVKNQKIN